MWKERPDIVKFAGLPADAEVDFNLDRLRDACRAEQFSYEPGVRLEWNTQPIGEMPVKAEVLGRPAGEFHVHPATYVTAACAFFGGLIGVLFCLDEDFPLRWYTALTGGTVGGAVVGLVIYFTGIKKQRHVVIDFKSRTIHWEVGSKSGHCGFSNVARISLRGIRWQESLKQSSGPPARVPSFRVRLEINVHDREVVLLETDEWRGHERTALNDLAALGVLLSDSCDAPGESIGFLSWGRGMCGKITPARIFQSVYMIPLAVVIVLIFILISRAAAGSHS